MQVEKREYVHDDDDRACPGGAAGRDGARPVIPQRDPVEVGPDRDGKRKERENDQRHGAAHGEIVIHADQGLQQEKPHRGPEHQDHGPKGNQTADGRESSDDAAIGVLPLKGGRQVLEFVQPPVGQVREGIHDSEHGQGFRAVGAPGDEQVDDGPAQGLYADRYGQGPVETQHIGRGQGVPSPSDRFAGRVLPAHSLPFSAPASPQRSPNESTVAIDDHGQFRQDAEVGRGHRQQNGIGLYGRRRKEQEHGHHAHADAHHHGIADEVGPPYPQQQPRQKPRDPHDQRNGQQESECAAHRAAEDRVHGVKLVDHP